MKIELKTLTDTKKLAVRLIKEWSKLERPAALVVGLVGPLGAGKTTFTQFLAKELKVKNTVNSPTFVLMKEYNLSGHWQKLVHLDAYRLTSEQSLIDIGFEDYLKDDKNIILIEWADRVKKVLPPETCWLIFSLKDKNRQVEIK